MRCKKYPYLIFKYGYFLLQLYIRKNIINLYLIFRYVKILYKYKKYQMKYLKNIKKHIKLKK